MRPTAMAMPARLMKFMFQSKAAMTRKVAMMLMGMETAMIAVGRMLLMMPETYGRRICRRNTKTAMTAKAKPCKPCAMTLLNAASKSGAWLSTTSISRSGGNSPCNSISRASISRAMSRVLPSGVFSTLKLTLGCPFVRDTVRASGVATRTSATSTSLIGVALASPVRPDAGPPSVRANPTGRLRMVSRLAYPWKARTVTVPSCAVMLPAVRSTELLCNAPITFWIVRP